MIRRIVFLTWLIAVLVNSDLFSQSRSELKNNFYDAESWILFEAYNDALPLYLGLLKVYPENNNFKYRIGQCYINLPGEKGKAVSYLEDAVKNINPKYKEGKFRETKAPYDALYYLANAYRITNQLDKALATYKQFKQNLDTEIYDSVIVNLQIQSCINARELMKKPLYIKEKNLGKVINESNSEFNPVISVDEKMLVFSKSEAFYDAILFSVKEKEQWTGPVNMNEMLRVDRDLFPTSISSDGKTLYLYSSADYDGIIYSSQLVNNVWSPIVKLNDNINTKYWESHATVSHDNKLLYFTSNRKGSLGGLDIYVAKRDSSGDWGPAENLGPTINTPYNEESPFLSEDDKTLFFSSRGHFNMGGYDIYYSTLLPDNKWSVPLNAGYPFNSTDDDVFFNPLKEGYEGYYAKESPGGYGKQDIYRIEIFSDNHPRKFFIKGMAAVADLKENINDSIKVSATSTFNASNSVVVYTDPQSGEYKLELPHGDYQVTYEADGGEKITKSLFLPLTNPSDSFVLPGTILPKSDFVSDLNVGTDQTIYVTKGDSILFPLSVEPNSTLKIEHWVGDSLISSEEYFMTGSSFNYKVAPKEGDNKIVFTLTDKFNNTTTTEVFIKREKGVSRQPVIRPEYSRVIAERQIAALIALIKSRSDDKIIKVIEESDIESHKYARVDDVFSFIKEEAAKKSISPEEIDRVALKVAVMDNILSQAAVDYMAKYTEGELKNILSGLDIYKENLKTWTDLQKYIASKTGGAITPEDLNRIAAEILMDIDPAIALTREKILAYSEVSESETLIRQSVNQVDILNFKTLDKWLIAFCNESVKQGLTKNQLADLLAAISSMPGTTAEQYLQELIKYSEEPLKSSLKSLDLRKEKIRTPADLIAYLLMNDNKSLYPEEEVIKSIGKLIVANDIPTDTIKSHAKSHGGNLWPLWIIIGAGLFLLFFIYKRRKKENRK